MNTLRFITYYLWVVACEKLCIYQISTKNNIKFKIRKEYINVYVVEVVYKRNFISNIWQFGVKYKVFSLESLKFGFELLKPSHAQFSISSFEE